MKEEHEKELHSIAVPVRIFWAVLLGICVLSGILLGVLMFESKKVVQITNELVSQRQQYKELQEQLQTQQDELMQQNSELAIQNEELTDKVQVLSDTINKRVLEDEAAAQQQAQARIPTGFPVTGSAKEAEAPKEEVLAEMAVYYEAAQDSVVAATAQGQVISVRKNAYDNYEIQIDHENGYVSVYTNAGYPLLELGTGVLKGTPLFYVSGENTLVQYQISKDGAWIDVYTVMGIDG